VILNLFSFAHWPFVYLEKHLFKFFPQLEPGYLCCWVLRVLNILWILSHIRYMIWKSFLSFCWLPFHSVDSVFWCTFKKIFRKSNLYIYLFSFLYLWWHIKFFKISKSTRYWRLMPAILATQEAEIRRIIVWGQSRFTRPYVQNIQQQQKGLAEWLKW
jgi:FlaA1/EpsC-like NDP-sugar epimerase